MKNCKLRIQGLSLSVTYRGKDTGRVKGLYKMVGSNITNTEYLISKHKIPVRIFININVYI